jgi:recombinational DNA repair protein RecT
MSNLAKLESDAVKGKFLKLFRAVHNISDPEMAESFFEKELFFFKKNMEENPKLKECTEMSIIGTFLEVVSNGLSFEKIQGHVYIMSRNTKVGDGYETRMSYEIAKNGAMYLVKRAGSIKDVTDPTIVYEGDEISVKNKDGVLLIDHSPAIPRKSGKILGAYCAIISLDGKRESTWFPIERINRLMDYSKKQNKRWDKDKKAFVEGKPNELYTSNDGQIDEGFFLTKVVKSAIKNYSKKSIEGTNEVNDGEYVQEDTYLEQQLLDTYVDKTESVSHEEAKVSSETVPDFF